MPASSVNRYPDKPVGHIRNMRSEDLAVVAGIEQICSPAPWAQGIFESCLSSSYQCLVVEVGGEVVGFAILNLGFDEAHIMNLGVAIAHRQKGIGRNLMMHLLTYCQQCDISNVLLEVRVSNFVAIALYRSIGFGIVGRRVGYYALGDGREDAINMALNLK